ncbi:AraC family transcriptional regulator [Flavobacterium sp. K5-23]|uniref:helix-turn-helix domain-containing protein n=1 Tax=Flavobacterium sp. K5-23 TaxID=2746225 RepID=UPI0020103F51|nr:AraC family transcriptional regulator [Flavobacterium sp. K5-23]UQD56639.1 helix-turn-helix transcriptional regulator [Flavobacterium sp. K5-23]
MSFYSEYYVNKECERFVNKIWALDNSTNQNPIENKLILPNGCFNLAIVSGNGIEVHTKKKQYVMDTGIYFCSQMTSKVSVDIMPNTKVIIVQLHAWTVSMFPNYDLSDFIDTIVEMNQNDLPFKGEIDPNLFTNTESVLLFINENFGDLNKIQPSKTLVEQLCDCIKQHPEDISVSEITSFLKTSQRTLQIKFKKATGLTIKNYIKILKLRKTIDTMVETGNEKNNLTAIALDNDYFDQSHFNKTFQEMIKMSPKKFDPNSFILSEKR